MLRYIKDGIPEKFSEVEGVIFSFVHVDVDLHEPTMSSIQFMYPRYEYWCSLRV